MSSMENSERERGVKTIQSFEFIIHNNTNQTIIIIKIITQARGCPTHKTRLAAMTSFPPSLLSMTNHNDCFCSGYVGSLISDEIGYYCSDMFSPHSSSQSVEIPDACSCK